MNNNYKVVESYHRQAQHDFFRAYPDPFYNVTVEMDVTAVRSFARAHGYSTFFNLCYLFTRAMQGLEDFRYRLVDDRLVLFEQVHFSATVATGDGLYAFGRFEYLDDIHAANRAGQAVIEQTLAERTLTEELPAPNFAFYSALPKLAFTGLTHVHPLEPTAGEPRVSFGKFVEREGRLMAAAGIGVNHIFIDGRALGGLVETAQELFDVPR